MTTTKGTHRSFDSVDWNFDKSLADPIHSIHPYPAKFIPEIPRTIITNLPIEANTLVLDPFCGSGVTLLEAQRLGYDSLGIDLNPIACLLSRVKTSFLPENFKLRTQDLVEAAKSFTGKIEVPNIPNLDHWFKQDIQKAIATLLKFIKVEVDDVNYFDHLAFCLSSIIVKVSNQESDTRYASIQKRWRYDDVFTLFLMSVNKLVKAKEQFFPVNICSVINKSSLELDQHDVSKKVGLVVTSPPYPNAYEYWLYHKYRMWWLEYDALSVKEQEIGARAHYFKKNHQTKHDFYYQMDKLFKKLIDLTVDGAYMCFVVGRSKIHGEIIDNQKIIEELGIRNGLRHISTTPRIINAKRKSFNLSYAKIKEEYLVLLKK